MGNMIFYCLVEVLGNLTTWQHPVIILKDIKYKELSGIVEFIYHGEVSIDQDCLPGFLHAAESLRIKGLTQDKKVEYRGFVVCGDVGEPLNILIFTAEQRRPRQSRK